MIPASLRLFKAVAISNRENKNPDADSLRKTIPLGYVLDPDIKFDRKLLKKIDREIGLSGQQANATFHKSWEKVRSAKIEQLVLEQILHYITTYGYKSVGIYDPSTVFIPNEKLEVPEVSEDISLTYIRGLTRSEMLVAIIKLGSGVALHEQSLTDIMTIVREQQYSPDFLDSIKNHELRTQLYDHYGLVPSEPVAFLRYAVFRLTGSSLLIKNDRLINEIKKSDPEKHALLNKMVADAPEDLASIFYRFKPIFLAMKSIATDKNFFNRLRKKAVRLHRPLPVDYLNSVTEQIKGSRLRFEEFQERLAGASVFRRIRLAYALHFRLYAGESIVYPIRNGRGWATEFAWPANLESRTAQAFDVVWQSLVDDLKPAVDGKACFIPAHMNYALPSSEKQFAGPFPFGSYVTTTSDTVFGVHWFNSAERSIDLDLSLLSAKGKVGWDAAYRNEEAAFSGDITDAPLPLGATEMFHIRNGIAPNLVMCNYFNFSAADPVDAKIIVAREAPKKLTQNYMVDPNRIIAKADVRITRKQTVLGLVMTVNDETRFYFGNVSIGCGISSRASPHANHARQYLTSRFTDVLELKSILQAAGATIVEDRPDSDDVIDLSPENLTKSSLLSLFESA